LNAVTGFQSFNAFNPWLILPGILRKEEAVPFLTEFGELAFRVGQRSRYEYVIIGHCSPFHLCAVAHEGSGKTTKHGICVADIHPVVDPTPDDSIRHDSRRARCTAERGIVEGAIVEDGYVAGPHGSVTLAEVDLNSLFRNGDRPEQTGWMIIGWIQIVDLCARTGLIDVHSNQGERTFVDAAINTSVNACHEPHVGANHR